MGVKKKSAVKQPVEETEVKQEQEPKRRRGCLRYAVYALILFFLFPAAVSGVRYVGGKAIAYYKFMLMPKKLIPDILPDFKKDDGEKRQRRRGILPDRKDGGINWTFAGKSYDGVKKYARENIPAGADKKTILELRDCFYNAADAIYDGETTTGGRSLAFLKKEILLVADETWEDYFKGLTGVVAGESVDSMDDVASLYEDIGDALDAAGK